MDCVEADLLVPVFCCGEEDPYPAMGHECGRGSVGGEEEHHQAVEEPPPGNPVVACDRALEAADDILLILPSGHPLQMASVRK